MLMYWNVVCRELNVHFNVFSSKLCSSQEGQHGIFTFTLSVQIQMNGFNTYCISRECIGSTSSVSNWRLQWQRSFLVFVPHGRETVLWMEARKDDEITCIECSQHLPRRVQNGS